MRYICLSACFSFLLFACNTPETKKIAEAQVVDPSKKEETKLTVFQAPDTNDLKDDEWGRMVRYGARIVRYSTYYIGPDGVASKNLRNKMTCTNCHLDAGTRPFGLNFFDSHRTYPQYRSREDAILTMSERVNNCITRPHAGKPLALDSKEMVAIVSYIKWVGEGYDPAKHEGYGLKEINYDSLRADPNKGAVVYSIHCQSCHLVDGGGIMNPQKTGYVNPPLWGPMSYQEGSSMHRVLKAARFIKYNMPNLIAKYNQPALSDQEALDVAAFINDGRIHPRPVPKFHNYPNIATKPVDYFKGPYLDPYSEDQHAFGPWYEIEKFYADLKKKENK